MGRLSLACSKDLLANFICAGDADHRTDGCLFIRRIPQYKFLNLHSSYAKCSTGVTTHLNFLDIFTHKVIIHGLVNIDSLLGSVKFPLQCCKNVLFTSTAQQLCPALYIAPAYVDSEINSIHILRTYHQPVVSLHLSGPRLL
jgi:hypothetical protein